ncbi:hypothetical protein ACW7EJ_01935, partial [Acinetobacter soli]
YKTQQILSLCTSRGAVHDFELFKRNLNQIPVGAFILADKGYQGIYTDDLCINSEFAEFYNEQWLEL